MAIEKVDEGLAASQPTRIVMVNVADLAELLEVMDAHGWVATEMGSAVTGLRRGSEKARSARGRVSLLVTDRVVRLDVARERRAA